MAFFASSFCVQLSLACRCCLGALGEVNVNLGNSVKDELGNWMILLGRILAGLILMSLVNAAWLTSDPEIKCYLPGIPRANYMPYPFQILHSERAIFFSYEYAGAVRNIHLTDPGEAPIVFWMGQSYGYWEGDTLVIEVTGQNDRTWFDRAGNHHSDVMKVTERYTPTSDYTMDYQVTIEDDKTFTAPWQMQMTLYRRTGVDA